MAGMEMYPIGPSLQWPAVYPAADPVQQPKPELRTALEREAYETPREDPVQEPVSLEEAKEEVEQINKIMEGLGNRLEFGLFEDTDQFYVQIIDRWVNQVVKVMPPERLLELRSRIGDAVGMILDERQ